MEVSTYVLEALSAGAVYGALEHQPAVIRAFQPACDLSDFAATVDASFANVFNQHCGYYQLKRFAAERGAAGLLSFVEDVTEFRLTTDARFKTLR